MTKAAPGLYLSTPWYLAGLFRRRQLREAVEAYWLSEIEWRWATAEDWPLPSMLDGSDFLTAREGGFGFVADGNGKTVFLAPRGFDEPEWSLADWDIGNRQWRLLGDFEPASPKWTLPLGRPGLP